MTHAVKERIELIDAEREEQGKPPVGYTEHLDPEAHLGQLVLGLVRDPTFRCFDCNEHFGGYMVLDEIWKQAMPENKHRGYLCMECLEKRIQRELTIEDLKAVPINKELRLMYARGRKARP